MIAALLRNIILILLLAAPAWAYDAISSTRLVPNNPDPAVAAYNTRTLTWALNEKLYPIEFPPMVFYFAGEVKTPARVGCGKLVGAGAGTLVSEDSKPGTTRLCDIDGGKFFILRGTGFVAEGIEFQGRRWKNGDYPPTTVSDSLVEVEGRHNPATGLHAFRQCTFSGSKVGIRTLPGYYDDTGNLLPAEAHADQSLVDNCHFFNVGSCFRSENQQSLGWAFRDCTYNQHWSGDFPNAGMVVFDVVRGGALHADGAMLNHNRVTLFKVRDYSHNEQHLNASNVQWDNFNGATDYLTLFQYDGPIDPNGMKGYQWSVRAQGGIGNCYPDPYDKSKLIVIPKAARDAGFPVDDLMFDMARLPSASFTRNANWWVPK